MKDRTWETEFESHTIRVINKISLRPPFTGEVLEIDGEIVDEIRGDIFRAISTLTGKLEIDGKEQNIEARIAPNWGRIRTGCQIFVDGVQVGGDYAIRYPDPKIMDAHSNKGFFNYFLRRGLLRFGVFFVVFMTLIFHTEPLPELIIKSVYLAFFLAVAMSFMQWRGIRSRAMHIENLHPGKNGI